MKRILPYGALSLPDDWEDRTSYQFVSPPMGPDVPMVVGTGAHVSPHRVSIILSMIQLPSDLIFEQFLAHQLSELRTALPGLRAARRDEWQHPTLGAVPTIDVSFSISPGQDVRQLQFLFQISKSKNCINLTISTTAANYERDKTCITAIFETFEPASPDVKVAE